MVKMSVPPSKLLALNPRQLEKAVRNCPDKQLVKTAIAFQSIGEMEKSGICFGELARRKRVEKEAETKERKEMEMKVDATINKILRDLNLKRR